MLCCFGGAALLFFFAVVTFSTVYAVLNAGYRYRPENFFFDLYLVTFGAAVCTILSLLLTRIADRRFGVQALVATLAVVVASVPMQLGVVVAAPLLLPTPPSPKLTSFANVTAGALFWLAPLGLWAAATLALLHDQAGRRKERRLAALHAEAQDARLNALRHQVNPHFLYNALNSIATLILDGRNAPAEKMVLRLARFFRASMKSEPAGDVPLAQEVELQRLYLDVERLRFSGELAVEIDVEHGLEDVRVPGLILQPLIENALKHGLADVARGPKVAVTARRAEAGLILEVSDNGPGLSNANGPGCGVGLDNIRRRLATRYGSQARLDIADRASGGCRVRLHLPIVTE